MRREWISRSEKESEAIAREIASLLPSDAVVDLKGDLGAGKTFLVKAMAVAFGADPAEVASPSFAIVHEYPLTGRPAIIHIDGYRLSDSDREWAEIGIFEMLRGEGLKFVEWPKEPFRHFAPRAAEIEIAINEDDSRTIRFTTP